MSVDLSGEITAIATAVLAAFAIVTAWYARKAFLKQSQEVSDIQKREFRRQAAKVTAWLERPKDGPWEARIRNDSDQAIFDVLTSFHAIQRKPGEGWEPAGQEEVPRDEIICVFPPRTNRSVAVPEKVRAFLQEVTHQEVTDRTCVVSITFTDAAEIRWERDPRGALVALPDQPKRTPSQPLAGLLHLARLSGRQVNRR